ncbi:MAG: DUF551 domain-containing protein [Deltaproteobacteria bacterium]|nr:DUF551 domain-containing protein [Deltaproteobacteria bacterium]
MEWISVEDRLPDFGGDVLVILPDGRQRVVVMYHGPSEFYSNAVEYFPTHWMPLPTPPEAGK